VQQYLSRWFDVDRAIMASLLVDTPPPLGIVMFHSTKKLGTKEVRIVDQQVAAFWSRQGVNPFCSTEAVYLPGSQEEVQNGYCDKCDKEVVLAEKREKGVDTSITTYLLETSEKWESVIIASSDVDYVPPVRSLKRRGKQVFCLVEPEASTKDLAQVCTSHRELDVRFVVHDAKTMEILRKGGGLVDQQIQAMAPQQLQNLTIGVRAVRTYGKPYFAILLGVAGVSLAESTAMLKALEDALAHTSWDATREAQPSEKTKGRRRFVSSREATHA
jgi:hypothetical protein